ncbi:MAG: hypothetical protein U0R72_12835 [Nakamurella multipartita]
MPTELHAVITAELARRADVAAVDPRLTTDVDVLVEFIADGGKRLRPQFLWCGWLAGVARRPVRTPTRC